MVVAGLIVSLASVAGAVSFTGNLSIANGGLMGTGSWGTGPTDLSWVVTDLGGGLWSYDYTMTMPSKSVSHFIIETSPTFTLDNIIGIGSNVAIDPNWEVKTYDPNDPGNSNPNLPGSIYGAKFNIADGVEDSTLVMFSLTSDRDPIWGDFYAKDGTENQGTVNVTVGNTGFLLADPLSGPVNGSIENHLLVPDTTNGGPGGPIPEPMTMATFAMALAGVGAAVRKRLSLGI